MTPEQLADLPPEAAEEALRQARTDGAEITIEMWIALAISYAAAGHLVGADHVTDELVRQYPAWAVFVPVMRHMLASLSMTEEPDFGWIMAEFVRAGMPVTQELRRRLELAKALHGSEVTELERQLEAADPGQREVLWRALLDTYGESEDPEAMERTLDRMIADGVDVTARDWSLLIMVYGIVEGIEAAQDAFARAIDSGAEIAGDLYLGLASAYVAASKPAKLCRLIDVAEDEGIPVTTELWEELLLAHEPGDSLSVRASFDAMRLRGIEPTAQAWSVVGMASSRLGYSGDHAALDEAVAAYQESLRLAPGSPITLLALLDLARETGRDSLADEVLREIIKVRGADGIADYTHAIARLEPMLGPEHTATLTALLRRKPRSRELHFRAFRDAVRKLEPEYGRIVPLAMAFPSLIPEDHAYELAEKSTAADIRDQALDMLARVYPSAASTRATELAERPRLLASRITGHDLLTSRTLAQLEADAAAGDFDAAEYLSFYERGQDDRERVHHWDRRRVEIDMVEDLVRSTLRGLEMGDDLQSAVDVLHEAADQGNARAAYHLGRIASSYGAPDLTESMWLRAAELGSPDAPGALAAFYEADGQDDDASRWARVAADRGDPTGYSVLGFLASSRGRFDEAEEFYRQCLAFGGTASVRRRLGRLLVERGSPDDGIVVLAEGADAGDAKAAADLADIFHDRGDDAESVRWFERAAELGDMREAAMLGCMLAGDSRTAEAEYWLIQAARADIVTAGPGLAEVYLTLGNVTEAERWCRWTAAHGDESANEKLLDVAEARGDADVVERWREILELDLPGSRCRSTTAALPWLKHSMSRCFRFSHAAPRKCRSHGSHGTTRVRQEHFGTWLGTYYSNTGSTKAVYSSSCRAEAALDRVHENKATEGSRHSRS